jgi:membrane associated rhomboid family serine protease
MRSYLANLPRWALALTTGLPVGTAMGMFTKLDGPTSWTEAVVGGLVIGVAFGLTCAFSMDKRRREVRAAVGDLPTCESKGRTPRGGSRTDTC